MVKNKSQIFLQKPKFFWQIVKKPKKFWQMTKKFGFLKYRNI